MKLSAEDIIRFNEKFIEDEKYIDQAVRENYDLYVQIKEDLQEFPSLTTEERKDFAKLLAGLINDLGVVRSKRLLKEFQASYQGY